MTNATPVIQKIKIARSDEGIEKPNSWTDFLSVYHLMEKLDTVEGISPQAAAADDFSRIILEAVRKQKREEFPDIQLEITKTANGKKLNILLAGCGYNGSLEINNAHVEYCADKPAQRGYSEFIFSVYNNGRTESMSPAISVIRKTVHDELKNAGLEHICEDVEFCIGDVAINVVEFGPKGPEADSKTIFQVGMVYDKERVVAWVTDNGGTLPKYDKKQIDLLSERGRGRWLIREYAHKVEEFVKPEKQSTVVMTWYLNNAPNKLQRAA